MRVVIEKNKGETPLMAIERLKSARPELASLPACYAGRLDPMASGKLLILFGSACKKKDKYQKLDKEYVVEVLLDVGSDTGDVLGIASSVSGQTVPTDAEVQKAVSSLRGTHELPYPAFSSKTVNGKPLFLYALEGVLGSISIPTHAETIYRISVEGMQDLPSSELRAFVEETLALVPRTDEPSKALGADFRIDAVRESWKNVFTVPDRTYHVLTLRVACASGTYMRTLAGNLGRALGTNALALSIQRTKIGHFYPLFRLWRDIDNIGIEKV